MATGPTSRARYLRLGGAAQPKLSHRQEAASGISERLTSEMSLVAPLLASFVAACSSSLTAFVSPVTPLLTPRHANGLSLSIRNYQCSRG